MPAIANRQAAQPLESDKAKESKRTPFNEKGVLSTFTGVIYEKTKEKTEQPMIFIVLQEVTFLSF